ncbi:putative nucleoredoxin 1-1 [Silene latifolia]|uniref:putative nucleoredoxin 1-1 n=1 Tax=Silene latifolia TaxID=37657 RepID=UPI003D772677
MDEHEDEEELEVAAINRKKQGDHVDVKALLSSKARDFLVTSKGGKIVPISGLDGKFVIVCCFLLPIDMDTIEISICHAIEALYSELSLNGIADNVKLVIVAKIAPGFSNADFDSFFSRLSVNCLAIPFSDSKSRDKICTSFGLRTAESSSGVVPCLVVHPNGKALQFDPFFLYDYGAKSFPFTKEHVDNIRRQDGIIKNRLRSIDSPIFLEELLQCGYLSRIASEYDYIPTSDLKDTVVALYLCYDESFMGKLQDIHQKCFDEGFKFEIVLVPLPFYRHYETPSFHDRMKQLAMKHTRSSTWWTFPFDDKVYRTLWRLFSCEMEDQLIVLPHGQCLGDLWGKDIANFYGMKAYPFTRDVIISQNVNELRSFTLQQLLGNTLMSDLQNKNVLLYFDYPTFDHKGGYLYNTLKQEYQEIKDKYADSEVVFVSLEPDSENSRMSEMKWPILPPEMFESVIKHIFPDYFVHPTLVAFGRDGKILSRSAQYRLPVSTSSASLFDDTLASEIETEIKWKIK